MLRFRRKLGFTLVELIIVILIIGILAAIASIRYGNLAESARSAEAYSVLSEIVASEKRYDLENDSYTTSFNNLDIDVPASSNFTFNVPSANSSSGYVQAVRVNSNNGRLSYGMCLSSGKKNQNPCNGNSCDPGCP